MRILWVSHSARLGGAELSLVEGVRALVVRGHQVDVVLPGDGPLQSRLSGIAAVHVVPHNPWLTESASVITAVRWMGYNVAVASRNLARLAVQIDADVVVGNSLATMASALGARLARRPHVWCICEFGDLDHGAWFILGKRPTFAAMERLARLCIVPSDALRRCFSARLPRVDLRVAPNAVSVPRVRRTRAAEDTCFRFLVVGRKTASKGQMDAVLALPALAAAGRNVELWLVGGGDPEYEQALCTVAREQGVAPLITSLGFDPNPFTQICNADAVLMCSRAEAFGRVTVEAMKAGKPVIGSATGATPELVRHGWNGFLYRHGDVHDLARWADVLYCERATARAMGQRGQRWATEVFNDETCGSALEAALVVAPK